MPMSDAFSIWGLWQPRAENAQQVANRLRVYLALIKSSLPPDLKWWMCDDDDCSSTFHPDANVSRLAARIAESKAPDDESPTPYMGFSTILYLAVEDPSTKPACGARLRLGAGAAGFRGSYHFDSDVFFADKADPRLITYDMLRANMMALVWAFRPEWSQTAPYRLSDYIDGEVYNRPFISLAWMTWLEKSLAEQVKPPARYRNTITEAYSDGSLFMATGTEPFSCYSDQNLRSARAIHRQLDHLNYIVPFEGQCGRSPRVPPFPKL